MESDFEPYGPKGRKAYRDVEKLLGIKKSRLWWITKNPHFNNIAPIRLLKIKPDQVYNFIYKMVEAHDDA